MNKGIIVVCCIMGLVLGGLVQIAMGFQYSGEVSLFDDLLAFSTGPSKESLIVVFGEKPSEVDLAFSEAVEHIADFHFEIGAPGTIQVDALAEGLQMAVIVHTSLETLDPAFLGTQFQMVSSTTFQVGDLLALKTLTGAIWTVEISTEEIAQALKTGATSTPEPSVLVLLGVGLLGMIALKKWMRR